MSKIVVTERRIAIDDYETIIVEETETGTIVRTLATVRATEYAEVFAAAPELLEALEELLLYPNDETRATARAAIRKVKGAQS